MNESLFPGLEMIRRRLDDNQQLQVLSEGGFESTAGFQWHAGASGDELLAVERALQIEIPAAYREFLEYTNGATLFYDVQYGQWGYELFGTDKLVSKQNYWSEIYKTDWQGRWLVFAECYGDADILLLYLQQSSFDGLDCAVIDGDSRKLPTEWKRISRRFADWLDYLIVAQGAKYWRWL